MKILRVSLSVYQLFLIASFTFLTALPGLGATYSYTRPEGYWVIESNIVTKDFTWIRFYTEEGRLLYEEKIEGVSLDISRKKNVRMLNRTLKMLQHHTLVAGQIKGYANLVATALYKKRDDN